MPTEQDGWYAEHPSKLMAAEADVIIRLYNRLVEAEKYVEQLLCTARIDNIVLVDKDNKCLAEWLTDVDNSQFLQRVKEKYISGSDDE